jgi:class 3 adenylate cyclase
MLTDDHMLARADRRAVQRTFATVMFVDVRGSMELSRTLELERWWSLIDEMFELMCETVYAFGGWVGSFTGDGIKGVFETPQADGRHARRACDAALSLREAMRSWEAELCGMPGLALSVGIGINSGEVVTGMIGGRYKRYHTANGYAVALAKRIEALAIADRIYLSEHTAALLRADDPLAVCDLGEFRLKGADTPVKVFELM